MIMRKVILYRKNEKKAIITTKKKLFFGWVGILRRYWLEIPISSRIDYRDGYVTPIT